MTEERALTVRQPQGLALDTMGDLLSFGKVMVESGMFPDVKSQAQAVVKIVAGRELGLAPLYSLRKIYVINGQVTLSADAMASLIKRSGEYDYQVLKLDDSGCSVQFTKGGQPCGPPSTFTADDAKTAGLAGGNWVKFRRNMMFARALSNGARWYCPHIIGGTYTPDELGGSVNEDGEPEPPQTAINGASRGANVDMETGEIVEASGNTPPPRQAPKPEPAQAPPADEPKTDVQRRKLFALMKTLDWKEIEIDRAATSQFGTITKNLSKRQASEFIDTLEKVISGEGE